MQTGDRVVLVSFDGDKVSRAGTPPGEDYWKLVGSCGTTIDVKEERSHFASSGPDERICVQFDRDLHALGLEAHNLVKNSLWIKRSDLAIVVP